MSRWLPDNFMKNVKSVPSSSIQPTTQDLVENFNTEYKLNFTKASTDFWVKKVNESCGEYNKGLTIGKFGKYNPSLEDFFERLFVLVKESITSELANKSYTTEQIKHQFDAVETSFKILVDAIKNIDKENKINVDSLCAFLHGFVNSYIENLSEIKEKQV